MISRLRLRNVRRFEDVTVSFEAGTTFVEGPNNAGKTSLFYGIEYALFGRVGTVNGPAELIRPGALGMGVELCLRGRHGHHYRLQRVHQRKKAGGKLQGHFTLWVTEDEPEATERYLLSSDFGDREVDLAQAVETILGVGRRGWDLAMHLRQGRIDHVLEGAKELDTVLGVTASVFVEAELRAMALAREKAAAELPALEATLNRVRAELAERAQRVARIEQEAQQLGEKVDAWAARRAAVVADDASLPLRQAAQTLRAAEQTLAQHRQRRDERVAARDEAGTKDALRQAVQTTSAELQQRTAARDEARERMGAAERERDALQRQQATLVERLEQLDGVDGTCGHCGQTVDAAHKHAQVEGLTGEQVEVERSLAERTATLETLRAAVDAAETALSTAQAAHHAAEHGLAQHALAHQRVEEAKAEVTAAEESVEEARAAARTVLGTEDDDLLATLETRYEAERTRVTAAIATVDAEGAHDQERLQHLHEDLRREATDRSRLEHHRAEAGAQVRSLRADAQLAVRLRALAKGFKAVQRDLRKEATTALAARVHEVHKMLSGSEDELTSVDVDPKRYVVHVTPADLGRRLPAALAQGGGHRLLLGLSTRLALAEQLGPLPFVLLDEPTYGLDRTRRDALLERISSLGIAEQMLVITHHDLPASDAHAAAVVPDGATSTVEAR